MRRRQWTRLAAAGLVGGLAGSTVAPLRAGATEVDALQIVRASRSGNGVEVLVAVPERFSGRSLPREGFTVEANGAAVPVESFTPLPADRTALAVVVDTAAITAPQDLRAAQGAAVELLRGLEAGTPAMILSTAEPLVVHPLTADRAAVTGSLRSLRVGGTGGLEAAVEAARDGLGTGFVAPSLVIITTEAGRADGVGAALERAVDGWDGMLTLLDAQNANAARLIPAIDELAGSLTGRYLLTVADWGAGAATVELNANGRTYPASVEAPAAPAPSTVPSAPTSAPADTGTAAPAAAPTATVAPAATGDGASAGGRAPSRDVLLAALVGLIGIAAAVVIRLVVRRRRAENGAGWVLDPPDVPDEGTVLPYRRRRHAPLPPAADATADMGGWDDLPSIDDLVAWSAPGVAPGRTWIVSPSPSALRDRWSRLIHAEPGEKRRLFAEHSGSRTVDMTVPDGLPGYAARPRPMLEENREAAAPVRYARRSFDRQWVIPDKRVIDRPCSALWRLRDVPGQVFLTSAAAGRTEGGPAVTATAVLPQFNHYNGKRGRVWPLWLDGAGIEANVKPGVLELLSEASGAPVTGEDVFAYIVAVTAQPAFSAWASGQDGEGLPVPLTADEYCFWDAVALGREVLWLHTLADRDEQRDGPGTPRPARPWCPTLAAPIPHDPSASPPPFAYDEDWGTLAVGDGLVEEVAPEVWAYEVGGMRVLEQWLGQRLPDPARRRSALDAVLPAGWEAEWTTELLQLLRVLTRLCELEPAQDDVLERILAGPLIPRGQLRPGGAGPAPAVSPTRAAVG